MKIITIFNRTVKSQYKSWIIYGLVGVLFLAMYVPLYPLIRDQSVAYSQIIKTMPEALLKAFNIQGFETDLLSFLTTEHFGFVWPLIMILLAVSFGSFAIAKEIETKTLGIAFSQPVSRTSWYLGRLGAGKIGLLIFVAMSVLSIIPIAQVFGDAVDVSSVFYLAIMGFLFGLAVLSISMMVSSSVSSGGLSTGITGMIMLLMYGIYIATSLSKELVNLKYLSLFHYYQPGQIIKTDGLNLEHVAILIGISLLATIVGLVIFNKRELKI